MKPMIMTHAYDGKFSTTMKHVGTFLDELDPHGFEFRFGEERTRAKTWMAKTAIEVQDLPDCSRVAQANGGCSAVVTLGWTARLTVWQASCVANTVKMAMGHGLCTNAVANRAVPVRAHATAVSGRTRAH